MFQTKAVEKIKTFILCSVTFFFPKIVPFMRYWQNIVEWGRPQMTIWRMRIVCWIPKATNTHSEYVILIASPQQPCLHERVSIACLVWNNIVIIFTATKNGPSPFIYVFVCGTLPDNG
jgi:hypothetical protein